MNLYVGNIPFTASQEELKSLFEEHGAVSSVRIIKDRETGRSKGFGFVDMDDDAQAKTAIEQLDGASFSGRPLRVSEAKPRN